MIHFSEALTLNFGTTLEVYDANAWLKCPLKWCSRTKTTTEWLRTMVITTAAWMRRASRQQDDFIRVVMH